MTGKKIDYFEEMTKALENMASTSALVLKNTASIKNKDQSAEKFFVLAMHFLSSSKSEDSQAIFLDELIKTLNPNQMISLDEYLEEVSLLLPHLVESGVNLLTLENFFNQLIFSREESHNVFSEVESNRQMLQDNPILLKNIFSFSGQEDLKLEDGYFSENPGLSLVYPQIKLSYLLQKKLPKNDFIEMLKINKFTTKAIKNNLGEQLNTNTKIQKYINSHLVAALRKIHNEVAKKNQNDDNDDNDKALTIQKKVSDLLKKEYEHKLKFLPKRNREGFEKGLFDYLQSELEK